MMDVRGKEINRALLTIRYKKCNPHNISHRFVGLDEQRKEHQGIICRISNQQIPTCMHTKRDDFHDQQLK